MKHRVVLLQLLLLVALSLAQAQTIGFGGLTRENPIRVDSVAGEMRILAKLQPKRFSGGWLFKNTPSYHALVWKGGKAAGEAFLSAYVSDTTFYRAMVAIGARPGNNLTMATWKQRKNPDHPAPDRRIAGTPVEIRVWWPGLTKSLPLDNLFRNSGEKEFDFRFGGNLDLVPEWRSGCIVCLYSCPGSKIGNRAYTVRDYVRQTNRFSVNLKNVPDDELMGVVIFRLKESL